MWSSTANRSMGARNTGSQPTASECPPTHVRCHVINVQFHSSHVTEKKPFLKVDGEWNGIMHSTHPNGVSKNCIF